MTAPPEERRRWPRVAVQGTGEFTDPVMMAARLRDLSATGGLLSTFRRIERGDRGRLHATLPGHVLQADIEIRHVRPERGTNDAFRVGVRFLALGAGGWDALRSWLARARK